MYLLDTNILSEFTKKQMNINLKRRLGLIPSDSLYTASVCVMELEYGALRRGDGGILWTRIQLEILSKLQILGFGYKEALKAGEILHILHSSGQPIGVEDVLIGAIAMSHGLTVVSGNTRHFSLISGLIVENWLL
jgi:tRNA(fMet)-specific endonuclease VapC